jgi:putative ABC transport system substrate-binding protein
MKRREFIGLTGGTALLLAAKVRRAHAEQPRVPVIGFLNSESPGPFVQLIAAFHQGLNEIGYVEGKNVTVEYRWAKGQYARLREMAADLVSRQVAVIVATGASPSLLAARNATREIPTVLINGEPTQDGIAVSFNRPGRNATGVSLFSDMLSAKRLKLVLELVPGAAVIGLLVDPNSKESVIESSEVQEAAHAIGQRIIVFKAASERDLDSAFASIVPQQPAAVLIAGSPFFTRQRDQLVSLAARFAVPTVLRVARLRNSRRPYKLRAQPYGRISPSWRLRRSYSQWRQAERSAGAAAKHVRTGHQPQDGQSTRPRNPADAARPRRRGDRVNRREFIVRFC